MDFSKLMAAQIAKTSTKSTPPPSSAATKPASKYLKRSEVEAARESAYLAEQAAIESQKIAKAEKKRKADEEEAERTVQRDVKRARLAEESQRLQAEEDERVEKARRKRLGLPDLPPKSVDAEGDAPLAQEEEDMSDEDLVKKLREMEEPCRLFGETHAQQLRRYYRLKNPTATSVTAALEDGITTPDPKDPIPTLLAPVPEIDMLLASVVPPETDRAGRLFLTRQLTSWFTLVLRAWGIALALRESDVKSSMSGQQATASYAQALSHLKPMFRKFEKLHHSPEELPNDLLEPICKLVRLAQTRRYVDANDEYLQLSIGKAAWPIGVTMVGIHERSAREKLHETGAKAHILSDESTRKMLQSIKRCLSYAQTRWPPEDIAQLMG
jgi:pre-mRNA-splicing factor 18